jgi:hypothetical protein
MHIFLAFSVDNVMDIATKYLYELSSTHRLKKRDANGV